MLIKKKIVGFYLEKQQDNITIVYLSQKSFKMYVKHKYNIDVIRDPDEAYIIYNNNNVIIKILEKKIRMLKVQLI